MAKFNAEALSMYCPSIAAMYMKDNVYLPPVPFQIYPTQERKNVF
jgi:hypothetical protein